MHELLTPRLSLRPPTGDDFADSYALWSDPRVVRFIGGRPSTQEEAWQRLLRYAGLWTLLGFGYWIVRDRMDGSFVGEVGFADFRRGLGRKFDSAMEAGWVISPDRQGKGLAFEALAAALSWAEDGWPGRGFACMIEPENIRSIALAKGLGFRAHGDRHYNGYRVRVFFRDNTGSVRTAASGLDDARPDADR